MAHSCTSCHEPLPNDEVALEHAMLHRRQRDEDDYTCSLCPYVGIMVVI